MIYSKWYNVPPLLSVGGLECGGTDYVFGVKDVAGLSLFGVKDVAGLEQHPSHRQQSGDTIPPAVIHSLALLRMGKELPETC